MATHEQIVLKRAVEALKRVDAAQNPEQWAQARNALLGLDDAAAGAPLGESARKCVGHLVAAGLAVKIRGLLLESASKAPDVSPEELLLGTEDFLTRHLHTAWDYLLRWWSTVPYAEELGVPERRYRAPVSRPRRRVLITRACDCQEEVWFQALAEEPLAAAISHASRQLCREHEREQQERRRQERTAEERDASNREFVALFP